MFGLKQHRLLRLKSTLPEPCQAIILGASRSIPAKLEVPTTLWRLRSLGQTQYRGAVPDTMLMAMLIYSPENNMLSAFQTRTVEVGILVAIHFMDIMASTSIT